MGGMTPGEKITNHGAALLWPCPNCQCEVELCLVEYTALHILGSASSRYLTCMTCKFEQRIAPEEDAQLENATSLANELKAGQKTSDEYYEDIKALDCVFIRELQAMSEEWLCSCGEPSPVSFLECWSCGAVRPGVTIDEQDVEASEEEIRYKPGGGNAWEM